VRRFVEVYPKGGDEYIARELDEGQLRKLAGTSAAPGGLDRRASGNRSAVLARI